MSVEQQKNWDDFLEKWTVSRLKEITLEEYNQVGNKDSFTYWLEQATRPIADIRGGDASKFGIFHRRNSEDKENSRGRIYDGEYCWFEKFGETKEQAFQNIKNNILAIVDAIKQRNLNAIEEITISDMFKWKIAFLYQDRDNPLIIPIFWKVMLEFLTQNKKMDYVQAYEKLVLNKGNLSLFEYSEQLLGQYFEAHPKKNYLTPSEANEILSQKYPDRYISREKMTVVTNERDREIALVLTGSKVSIFIEIDPENNGQFSFNFKSTKDVPNGKYSEQDGRHSGLKSQSQHLWLGNQVYYIELDTVAELEKFCDWYEQSGDQIIVLERKVKAFLELWPVERLKNLTLSDYHQAKNADNFISQVDSFDPMQGDPTFACYFDFWEPIGLGNNEKYHNEKPYSWHKRLGDDPELAFQQIKQEILDIVDAVQSHDLTAIDQIQFTKGLKWMIAFLYQDFSDPCVIPIVTETNIKRIGYESYLKTPLPEFLPILIQNQGNQSFFPYVEKLFAMVRKGYLANKQKKQKNEETEGEVMMEQALNRILFGAAGTGKTYHSINHALSIIENKPLDVLENEDRTELKKRFDQHKDQSLIKFVTFHQSFSYEDFVEGIRAETDKQGQLRYDVKAGVFKEICDQAKQIDNNQTINQVAQPIEFGKGYILKKMNTELLEIQKPNGNVIHLSRILTDFLLREFRNGKITDRNLAEKKVIEILGESEILEPYLVNGYSAIWANLIPFLDNLLHGANPVVKEKSKYVIIIDEINRGNISRIFGELITLIEDSKRQGADEALSVTLPYSKKEFFVPDNVYIIGTMNSSDRSLTGLDIALRRRFTFIEMPPKPELLNDVVIEGLNVAKLLDIVNQRIEVLLDRDHCIGHANFMSLKEQPTVEHLAHIFKQKIIPQLQEYFFDDWAKINLVFFNNGMLVEDKTFNLSNLFPSNFEEELGYSNEKKIWKINEDAFKTIDAFIQILGSKE